MSSLITVLLVDDHAVVREGYRRLLERDATIQVVGEASDSVEAYERAARLYSETARKTTNQKTNTFVVIASLCVTSIPPMIWSCCELPSPASSPRSGRYRSGSLSPGSPQKDSSSSIPPRRPPMNLPTDKEIIG